MVDKKYPHMIGHNQLALALYVVVKAVGKKIGTSANQARTI